MEIENNSLPTISILSEFGELPLLRLRFCIKFGGGTRLPALMGSAWRGVIGWELKKLICPFDRFSQCAECSISGQCPYYVLYELKSSLPGLGDTPKGYILYSEMIEQNHILELNITLIGDCTKFWIVMTKAVFNGQKTGLGRDRTPYKILSWGEIQPNEIFVPMTLDPVDHAGSRCAFSLKSFVKGISTNGSKIDVRFTTPVRLRRKGKYISKMDWPFYFSCFARRVESLNCIFEKGSPLGKSKWKIIKEKFDVIDQIESNLKWCDYYRYSNRQKRKVPMGGLVGNATISTPGEWFAEWWKAISILHIGKGAAMGMGKVLVA